MVEIDFLTGSDRASWEALARGKDAYFEVERGDDAYERTWRRLLDDDRTPARCTTRWARFTTGSLSTPIGGA
ncbi:hypothetical protein ABZ815_43455 [Nonomuraea sp. NPDC047529]|uniref:hypothetical protein n=1 Tax=Nonomuraea sp. NPDC047529 TaxID=3155623 RepID=UPI0033C86490